MVLIFKNGQPKRAKGMENRGKIGTATVLNVKTCYDIGCQEVPDLTIALGMTMSLCIQAVRATLRGFPAFIRRL